MPDVPMPEHHGVDFEIAEAPPRRTRNVFAFD